MDVQNMIKSCKNILYLGFTSKDSSNMEWLNDACGELIKLCRQIHKYLLFESEANENIIENCFLCISQITCCIKYMEKTLIIEKEQNIVLPIARQHFLDRIFWCLSQISATVLSTDNSKTINTEKNFVYYMDIALDLVEPIALFNFKKDNSNIANQNAEFVMASSKIRLIVESLISHALGFANVALNDDKNSLRALCQKVLSECISFENECSLDSKVHLDQQSYRLKAAALENTLYQLDKLVNDCLLRLVFVVFAEIQQNPLDNLTKLKLQHAEKQIIDDHVAQFDEMSDKLMQIGIFAAAFAENSRIKSNIRSYLASIESLDSFLIPSIISTNDVHSKLFGSHWKSEIELLQSCIQKIIDTNSFCTSIIDTLSGSIGKLTSNYDSQVMGHILLQCDILLQHFTINYTDLNLNVESKRKLYFDDFKLMLQECKAANDMCAPAEHGRVIKRLKILLNVLKKFKKSFNINEQIDVFTYADVSAPPSQIKIFKHTFVQSDSLKMISKDLDDSEVYFKTFGIVPTENSILYQSKRKKFSQNIGDKSKRITNMPLPKSLKKRTSLRVAMFKRVKDLQTQEVYKSLNNDSMSLHITDILDQITDLSNTLSTRRD